MRRFDRRSRVCLLLSAVLVGATVGCPKPEDPSVSGPNPWTTAPGAWTTSTPDMVPEILGETSEPGAMAIDREEVASEPEAAAAVAAQAMNLVPIELDLPAPAFRGTPIPLDEPNVEKPLGKPRPPFLAPEGTVSLAGGRPVTASDPIPSAGELDYVTDGEKDASDFGYLELRPGTEWVQVDLGAKATIYAVLVWHSHAEARVYRDVIVQVSDDPDFLVAETVFNNDYDNTSGMGIGSEMGYVETSEGKLIDCRGVEGRFVRFYSKGSHIDAKNQYTEVEVFGKPAA
ncbi:discoidin domain-containing protein [Planctomycetota bacterium]